MFSEQDLGMFMHALRFAADKHQNQRRKGRDQLPYVNHLIRVTDTLWRVGEVRDVPTLLAALLHDTLEDTDTAPGEIEALFGAEVLSFVREVTDDKTLPKARRKELQIEHAPHLSDEARLIKLADKIDNVHDISHDPPESWPHERQVAYLDWAEAVVAGLRGVNAALEAHFDGVMREAREILGV
ncbi:MAG: bifunctional (p)ppGpp synthetase/guanosine-3',5'-bis(diphosphate) 3'-pyrophosphohydrolase [Anaerolineae bacterium]|nr:bifunctional (p)ppGpp synthetase/guanosine-3',5'-bis(diphosphate) 3'-pyrophosphohydrolase [Anaerolineae bacterium]